MMRASPTHPDFETLSFAGWLVLGTRLVLEIGALLSLAYWGYTALPTPVNYLLAILAPLAAVIPWATFVAPRAPRRLGDPGRLVIELLVFATATGALVATGQVLIATAFALAVAVDLVLLVRLNLR